jgi:hypothetical protein
VPGALIPRPSPSARASARWRRAGGSTPSTASSRPGTPRRAPRTPTIWRRADGPRGGLAPPVGARGAHPARRGRRGAWRRRHVRRPGPLRAA